MEEKNYSWLFKFYAVVGTVLSLVYTARFTYSVFGDWWVVVAVVVLLDVGFWVFDTILPNVRAESQRNLLFGLMGVWWIIMLCTSFGEGINSAINANIMTAAGTINIEKLSLVDVSVFIVSGIGNIGVLAYTAFRFLDPEMQHQLAMVVARAENATAELAETKRANSAVSRKVGRRRAIENMRKSWEGEGYNDAEIGAMITEVFGAADFPAGNRSQAQNRNAQAESAPKRNRLQSLFGRLKNTKH